MNPYYEDDSCSIYHGDAREVLSSLGAGTVVTDPPYNVGYHYDTYIDRLSDEEYAEVMRQTLRLPAVVLHYPEDIFDIASMLGARPEKVAAWVYNANTPRQWRMVAWFGCAPDFKRVRQPYKNLTDRRIQRLVENGSPGTALYDWWHDDQVKNVSDEKTEHPCQIPVTVMRRIVGITEAEVVIDPFMGSGTTLRAAKDLGRRSIGIEIDERYCEIAAKRLGQEVLPLGLTV